MTLSGVAATLGLGFVAGILGGLAGVGGSMVMLPGLHLFFGDDPDSVHHLYMAAAMSVNVAVALPAALRHWSAGAVRMDLLPRLLASTITGMLGGVLLSNQVDGDSLRLLLAVFILGYCGLNLVRILGVHVEPVERTASRGTGRLVACGLGAGLIAGLLGLGGGVLLVPLLQVACRVSLRSAIATSSAVICVTAIPGAGLKLATLGEHGQSWMTALVLAAGMAPTAIIGSRIGAGLTHSLPIRTVRIAITVLLAIVAVRLAV